MYARAIFLYPQTATQHQAELADLVRVFSGKQPYMTTSSSHRVDATGVSSRTSTIAAAFVKFNWRACPDTLMSAAAARAISNDGSAAQRVKNLARATQ